MADIITAQDLSMDASKQFRLGNMDEALSLYQNALKEFQALSDELACAETKNNISVIHLQKMQPQLAFDFAVNTDKVFSHYGDRRRQAMALGNLAAASEALGNKKDAISYYLQSSELFKQLGDHEMRSYVLQNLSSLQIRSGSPFEALATMKSALENKSNLSLRQKMLLWLVKIPFRMLDR